MAQPLSDRAYGGVPAAARRAQRRALLLDAALDVLDSDGLAAVSIRRVCRQANISPRYFYENFVTLEELLDAVIGRIALDAISRVAAVAENQPPTASLESIALQGANVMVAALVDDPRPLRILRTAGNDPSMSRRRDAMTHQILGAMRGYLRIATEDSADEQQIDVAARLLFHGWVGVLAAYADGELTLSRNDLVSHIAHLLVGVTRSIRA